MRDCSYIDRLSLLRLYSLQRRRERYYKIYVWKIIEGLVPNFSNPIVCTHSEHTLDSYLMNIVDHPCVPGFNNSLDGGDCIKWRTLCDDLAAN